MPTLIISHLIMVCLDRKSNSAYHRAGQVYKVNWYTVLLYRACAASVKSSVGPVPDHPTLSPVQVGPRPED